MLTVVPTPFRTGGDGAPNAAMPGLLASFVPNQYLPSGVATLKSIRSLAFTMLPFAGLLAPAGAWAAGADPAFSTLAAPAGATLSAMADSAPMRIILSLPMRDQAGAARYAAAVSEPGNALYGKFLTPREFGARFGGDLATYNYLRSWAQAQGLTVGARTDSRLTVSLAGTAGQFARLFDTRFAGFTTAEHGPGQVTLTAPHMPAALAGRVDGVIGLTSGGRYGLLLRRKPAGEPDVGTGLGGGYAPADIRTAYDIPAQTSSAKTEILGLFEQGGYFKSDITTYEKQYKLPAVKITSRSVNGASTAPVANGVDVEAALDIDAGLGMNPAIPQIIIYIDGADSFTVALVDSFNAMAQDNKAKVISVSYGQDEVMQGTPGIKAENNALMQLQTQGQTVFVSAGDDGAAGRTGSGLHAPDPGSQPLVTSVGGTRLTTVAATQKYASEVVWNDLAQGEGATGGGVSSVWTIPSYQVVNGTSVAVANGGSSTMRNVPDIAADASPFTGYSIYSQTEGGWLAVGGTSLSAPLWAGMATIINSDRVAAGQTRIGFFNPLLYQLGVTGKGFHDITKGNNGSPGFKAGKGYDNATGFGSLDLGAFLPTIVSK